MSRWTCRGQWWRGWRRQNGLELHIEGYGYTQTYGTRDLDSARMMVLDYLVTIDEPARETWRFVGPTAVSSAPPVVQGI